MLDRRNIHNSAMLRPGFCKSIANSGTHSFVEVRNKGYQQYIDCGTILKAKGNINYYGLRQRQLYNGSTSSNLSR